MDKSTLICLIGTQLLELVAVFYALRWTVKCYTRYPTKRWRFIAITVWLGISLCSVLVGFYIIALGNTLWCLWLDRTSIIIGYTAVGVTSWNVYKFYKRQGYGR